MSMLSFANLSLRARDVLRLEQAGCRPKLLWDDDADTYRTLRADRPH
jgi:hypothetical protein